MKELTVENEHGAFKILQDKKYEFWRVTPPPTDEYLRAFYEAEYVNTGYSFHDELYVDLLKRRAPEVMAEKGKVLEIGCGVGDKLVAFRSEGHECYGFEPGPADYKICKSKGLNVINQTFNVPEALLNGPFSIVVLTNVLEHLPDPERFLEELHSVLQPSGLLLIDVPNEFNPFQKMYETMSGGNKWYLSPPAHLNYFTPSTLTNLLSGKGRRVKHRTTRFPMESFLLMRRDYVQHPELGKAAHQERVAFEASFMGGNEETLWSFYDSLAEANLGREIIVTCEKA